MKFLDKTFKRKATASAPIRFGLLAAVAITLSACQTADLEPATSQFETFKISAPTEDTATVCHGYNCRYKSKIKVSAAEFGDIEKIFKSAPQTPAGERQAIGDVIGYLERKAGAAVGTADNPGGVLDNNAIGDPTKQDCVDEATTTTGYLVMLTKRGLVTQHEVVKPQVRGVFIDGRWQHFTAVIRETGTKDAFAIDSWFRPNGQPAVVMTLSDWLNDYAGVEDKQLPKAS